MAKKSDVVKFTKKQKFSTREKNRCGICGRSRAFIRVYGMCRICFREKALQGQLPGV
ncbi:MAG TPA: type Z 30S ribosomal protein S14, partial [Candidatus Levybacteria bacterium]|nr:type Z 30S ribosomal protein S14 [Candidatus Levybacteria bacterium]